MYRLVLAAFTAFWCCASRLNADDAVATVDVVKQAIVKSLPLLTKGAVGSSEKRKCFTCHNHALPILALAEAKSRGFAIDDKALASQVQHTLKHLEGGRANYLKGKGQGGRVFTAGYALWALDAGGHKPDKTTAAVTHFLLEHQKDTHHWQQRSSRPPTSDSDFAATFVALYGLSSYATDEQSDRVDARNAAVLKWLLSKNPSATEDRVFRLRSLNTLAADKQAVEEAVAELLTSQSTDGGWSQLKSMESDAYATATVLVALLRDGGIGPDHESVRKGIKYLIDSQADDGSWHVTTRAKPFQTYYETGFPHKKDQFISIAASSWATVALLLTVPEPMKSAIGTDDSP
ncbi:MAG: hypothetical protein O3A00_11960 [Planctomycetota bacterium]|nr:hypothetical protein [Planctomycetota bacterium]